ncbi:hypothetical protein NSE_0834 [Neorickettsia sennetsu str. Miyayama]|uniref:Uncharacterized protein n=1 Tax=Ehrlichia sennetsu (strain ATCC VR-367 / Miyayama) TaxID=222891 RepID=Q2GCU3_EHRS3|nr:hypothetical protein NSE_0834 [Neorickettsia sennetsu str. Miyayama]
MFPVLSRVGTSYDGILLWIGEPVTEEIALALLQHVSGEYFADLNQIPIHRKQRDRYRSRTS